MSTTVVLLALLASAAPGKLVSPAELAGRLGDPALVVLHVEGRDGEFVAGHLPGSRPLRYETFAVDGPDGLGSELPPLAVLRDLFEAVGVGATSQVVLYGSGVGAARAFFTLDYLGLPDVRILDGGLAAWRAEGRPIETGWDPTLPGPRGALAGLTPRFAALATADWIAQRLDSPALTLIDARPDDEFTGADGGMDGMHPAGHLAGARQLVWTDLVTPAGDYLSDAALRDRLSAAGASSERPVVAYCMIGMRASVVYFVARHLGFEAKMYDGSIVDWGRHALPVVTGRP